MKIEAGSHQPAVSQRASDKTELSASSVARQKTVKPGQEGDKVELSIPLEAQLKKHQVEQAKRVESIKSMIQAGQYKVSSLDVAQKMLTRKSNS